MILSDTTNTSALELTLDVISCDALYVSKYVRETMIQMMMKINDTTIENVA